MPSAIEDKAERTIFQQEWWLDCVTAGAYEEVTVKSGSEVIGRLPYMVRRRWGFHISEMPFLTHTLGPIIAPLDGRPNSQLLRRFTITTELLQGLPKLAYFRQALAPTVTDALAYQVLGYEVKVQHTFISDCADLKATWSNMRDKTRNLIRRSEERNTVVVGTDPDVFLRYYDLNSRTRYFDNRYQDPRARKLLALCLERDQGMILMSRDNKTNETNAAIFVVWDSKSMYYLMSTRSTEGIDSGAVSQLVWFAMKEANRRGLAFDFDGVVTPGTFRFHSGFGGSIATRFVVEKFDLAYHVLDKLRALSYGNVRKPFA